MKTAQLAALEHENWIDFLAATISCGRQVVVRREGGVATLLSGVPMRFFNQVFVEDDSASEGAIADGVAQARERGDDFVVNLRDGTDDRFVPLMARLGLVHPGKEATTPGMTLHPIPEQLDRDPGPPFEIRQVSDAGALEDFIRTVTAGFSAHPSVMPAVMNLELLERAECSAYVGYLDGAPVSSGLGWRTGPTIGVYSIATVESARRRGYGEAMTARVVADGAAGGGSLAALQASEMGRPIYERIGFRVSLRYLGYADAGSPAG